MHAVIITQNGVICMLIVFCLNIHQYTVNACFLNIIYVFIMKDTFSASKVIWIMQCVAKLIISWNYLKCYETKGQWCVLSHYSYVTTSWEWHVFLPFLLKSEFSSFLELHWISTWNTSHWRERLNMISIAEN
jgi:hypothetical protein